MVRQASMAEGRKQLVDAANRRGVKETIAAGKPVACTIAAALRSLIVVACLPLALACGCVYPPEQAHRYQQLGCADGRCDDSQGERFASGLAIEAPAADVVPAQPPGRFQPLPTRPVFAPRHDWSVLPAMMESPATTDPPPLPTDTSAADSGELVDAVPPLPSSTEALAEPSRLEELPAGPRRSSSPEKIPAGDADDTHHVFTAPLPAAEEGWRGRGSQPSPPPSTVLRWGVPESRR